MKILYLGFFFFSLVAAAKELKFPQRTNHVVDVADILLVNVEEAIEKFIVENQQGSNDVVVVTVPSLEGVPIEDYALQLARHWNLGGTEHAGILLLVAPTEKKVRLHVGYAFEGVFTDAFIHQAVYDGILQARLPVFKDGKPVVDAHYRVQQSDEIDWQGGIFGGVMSIISTINGKLTVIEKVRRPEESERDQKIQSWLKIFLGVGVSVLLLLLARKIVKF